MAENRRQRQAVFVYERVGISSLKCFNYTSSKYTPKAQTIDQSVHFSLLKGLQLKELYSPF